MPPWLRKIIETLRHGELLAINLAGFILTIFWLIQKLGGDLKFPH